MMDVRYTNSRGESVTFGFMKRPWCYGETDIFDMAQDYNSVDEVITSFSSGIRKLALTAILLDGSLEERDRFTDVISYDTRLCRHGRLYAGVSYMECFVSSYSIGSCVEDDLAVYDLEIVTDRPVWVRKSSVTLMASKGAKGGGLNYPHGYPHNYLRSERATNRIVNPFSLPCAVDITFPGPCRDPYVIIAGNRYQVIDEVKEGQLLIVRGFGERDVVLRQRGGGEISVFPNRVNHDRARIFEKIPPGASTASWPGQYNVSVDIYDEGLVPVWRQM